MSILSKNPATDQVLATFQELTPAQIETKLGSAERAFELWKKVPFAERAIFMNRLAAVFKKNAIHYGELMTREMGKPIKQAVAEAEKCAWVCEFYAEYAEEFLRPESVLTDGSESFVRFDPMGPILAVMPWNFPFWQVARFLAPALMAGNVGLLKHASNVPQCALAIEDACREAGFPEGVFQTLLIGSAHVEDLVKDPRIKAATLTGSEYAGSQLAKHCGEHLKKTVLELGGSDPFIVLPDADLDVACSTAVMARLQNNGQSCIAAKRFIVMKDIADAFTEKFVAGFKAMVVGDPMSQATTIGPLASKKFRDELHAQVEESIEQGAKLVIGGNAVAGPGAFYEPTILTNVMKGMRAYHEELFGPVASIIAVASEDEAIDVANDVPYGLGSSIWTRDTEKAKRLAERIEAGAVFINGMVKSDPRLPFGGVKRSGYGRELSRYGMLEFVNMKSVWVK